MRAASNGLYVNSVWDAGFRNWRVVDDDHAGSHISPQRHGFPTPLGNLDI
jgi:hypothetical protein